MAKRLIGYSQAGNPLYEYDSYDDPEYKTDIQAGGKDFQYQPNAIQAGVQPSPTGELPDLQAQLDAIRRGETNAVLTSASSLGAAPVAEPQKPKMSWAGFGENIAKDVTQLGQGLAAAPFALGKIVTERPWELLPLAGQVGKGIVQSYANLLTKPVETIYDKPVSSTLDILSVVLPAIKMAKTVKAARAAGKVAKGAAGVSDDIARAAGNLGFSLTDDNIDEIAKAAKMATGKPDSVWRFLNGATDDITGKAFREAPKNIDTAARIYANAWFTIPRAKAQMMKPIEVAKWMLKYGQKGSLDDMSRVSQVVSGPNGFVTQLTRDALGQVDEAVDISNATKAVNNLAAITVGVSPDDANKITRMIAMKTPTAPAGQLDDFGRMVYQADISKINAVDAYDLVKQLEKQWSFWHGKAISPVAGPNPNFENIAKLYKAASDEIVGSLDDAVRASGKDIIQGLKTTDNVAKFAMIHPNFARDFMAVKDWTEMRRLAAPFVKAGILSEWTTAQGLSVFAKAGINIGTRLMGGAGGYMLGGLPAMVGGMLVGPVVEPLIQKIATSSAPRMAAAFANRLAQIEPALRFTAGPAGVAFREAGRNIFARQIPELQQYDLQNQNPNAGQQTTGELPPELEAFERSYYGQNR